MDLRIARHDAADSANGDGCLCLRVCWSVGMTKDRKVTALVWLLGVVALALDLLHPDLMPGATPVLVAGLILLPLVHAAGEAVEARRSRRHNQAAAGGS